MTMRTPISLMLALVLGVACSMLVACGGSTKTIGLIPSDRADKIQNDLDRIRSAVDAGKCAQAARALRGLQFQLSKLPATTDPRLRARLELGAVNLGRRIPGDCTANTQTTQTTPTVTTQTQTVTTQTQTTTVPPPTTTVPTTTVPTTTPTTTVPTPTTTTPGGPGGGVTAPTTTTP
jgi:cell division septation protein DedD